MQELEGKGNGRHKGPSGTSGMQVDGRKRIRKGNICGRKWTK
jgi:hypothetical protein